MGRELVGGRSDSVGSRGALGTSRGGRALGRREGGGECHGRNVEGPGNFFLA